MSKLDYDHIVVGAGISGSCAAYQLAKRGKSVLLLEKVKGVQKKPLKNKLGLSWLKLIDAEYRHRFSPICSVWFSLNQY